MKTIILHFIKYITKEDRLKEKVKKRQRICKDLEKTNIVIFFPFPIYFKMKSYEKGNKIKAYVIRVNMPGHVTIGYQLAIHITSYFTVSPSIVDVYNAYHVPLERHGKSL